MEKDIQELKNRDEPLTISECKKFLSAHGITIDHINLIPEIKKNGNKSAHVSPVMSRDEFENIALSCRRVQHNKFTEIFRTKKSI